MTDQMLYKRVSELEDRMASIESKVTSWMCGLPTSEQVPKERLQVSILLRNGAYGVYWNERFMPLFTSYDIDVIHGWCADRGLEVVE